MIFAGKKVHYEEFELLRQGTSVPRMIIDSTCKTWPGVSKN